MKIIKDESGATVVIVAVMMTIILCFAALTIDIGGSFIVESVAQNVADATALSVGQYLPVAQNDYNAKESVINIAKSYAQKNGHRDMSSSDITFGALSGGKYHSVTVQVKKVYQTQLAQVVGVNNIDIEKRSTVEVLPVSSMTGAVPMAISGSELGIAKATGHSVTLKYGGGGGTEGNYGYVVLDGAKGNAAIIEIWMKYGYLGTNYVGQVIPKTSGNMAGATRDGTDLRWISCTHYQGQGGCTPSHYVEGCPRVMYVIVYESSSSTDVKITGFAPFILEDYGRQDEVYGRFLDMVIPAVSGGDPNDNFGAYCAKLVS